MNRLLKLQIGMRLRECRVAAGLSQLDLATDFLVTRQAVSLWERGKSLPTVLQLRELGLLLGASTDYLLYGVRVDTVGSKVLQSVMRPSERERVSED